MNARELKQKYIEFFISKGHVEIPSASLIPENDPTTLFISAGMHPLVPYLLGQPHPLGKRLCNVQKCVRTGDIDEVGDGFHHTFFEMLGNWSLGDYFKKEVISMSYEFLTDILKINPSNLHVTCFAGNNAVKEKDEVSANQWLSHGIPNNRIHFLSDNWWGPASITGPCGPDTEMFIDTSPDIPVVPFNQGNASGRYLEIWNDVLMQFNKNSDGSFSELTQKNIDTGMGVERTVAILSGFSDDYLTSIWQPIIQKIEEISSKKYQDNLRPFRIIADHIRTAVFMIADGVETSNKEAGYVLRRVIRRSIRQGKLLGIEKDFCSRVARSVLDNQQNYAGIYPELDQNKDKIISLLDQEEKKFRQTLNLGLQKIQQHISQNKTLSGIEAFDLYQSFGFPIEMIEEELNKNNLKLDRGEFDQARDKHVEQSRTLSAGKFKSGLADHSEIITKYHTATHLLHAALRQILGTHVQQSGSNITSERLRFDFSHPEKLSTDQVKAVENLVNQKINESIPVTVENMKFIDAQKAGALAFFGAKYPEIVSVYSVGDFSKEVCTGPHVKNISELGKVSITKEESAGSGKRRLYASLIS